MSNVTHAELAASTGSALVGHIAAGTGAVARTAQAALRDMVSVADFGAVGNGSTDDRAAIQAAIDAVSSAGGGTLLLERGKTYRSEAMIIVKDGVTLEMNGGKLLFELTVDPDPEDIQATLQALKLRNDAHVANGEIEVNSIDAGGLAGADVHAPICIGHIYEDNAGTNPSNDDDDVSNWSIRNMRLHSNKYVWVGEAGFGAPAIQIVGGSNNGLIENIVVPDSDTMIGGVHLDWGFVGAISSSDTVANMNANKSGYLAGTAYTTHPHNITIRNISIGALTAPRLGQDSGSFGIRLSACYNILVENVRAQSVTYGFLTHTGGDLGFEFARPQDRPLAVKNNRFVNCAIAECGTAYLAFADSYADNVGRAVAQPSGYEPMMLALMETNLVFQNVSGKGAGTAAAAYGCRAMQLHGGSFIDCEASFFLQGFNVDELTRGVSLIRCKAFYNWEHGIAVDHNGNDPEDTRIIDAWCHDNMYGGGEAGKAGIYVGSSKRVIVQRARLGRPGENDLSQLLGLYVGASALGTVIEDCMVLSHKSGGYAYALLVGFNQLGLFRDNRRDPTFAANGYYPTGALTVIPVERKLAADGREITRFTAESGASLTGLPLAQGDVIEYVNPAAGGVRGLVCTTASAGGWPAVLKSWGTIAA